MPDHMSRPLAGLAILAALAGPLAAAPAVSPTEALTQLRGSHPGARVLVAADGRVSRVYGTTLATGVAPTDTASRFVTQHAAVWGLDASELTPAHPIAGARHEQPAMYDAARDAFKFTIVTYSQAVEGVPVYGSRLSVLVRNDAGFPAVLAGGDIADTRQIGNWDRRPLAVADDALVLAAAREQLGGAAVLEMPARHVIFAGVDRNRVPARLAVEAVATLGTPADGEAYRRWRLLVDAVTGDVLHAEDLILHCQAPTSTLVEGVAAAALATPGGSVTGSVEAWATRGSAAAECDDEQITGMPYARIDTDQSVIFADADGLFFVDTPGDIVLKSQVRGAWFRVFNQQGEDVLLQQIVTPPANVSFLHNPENMDDQQRAAVNAYIESNRARDFALTYNPEYPVIDTQTEFTINVNIDDACNATYSGSAINFFRAQGGCNNTAFGPVVHHEYGHHLVQTGGSGQSEYGEGMGDVIGMLLTGDSQLARGFNVGNCENGIRNADNNCQLTGNCSSCGSEIHACGQLLSGCIWDTWQALQAELPSPDAFDVISSLTVNSILLHNGGSITPDIAIDFLTLDDDDGEIGNGTPHYDAIAFGFEAHGMDVPDLQLLGISFPQGRPDVVDPSGETTIEVVINGILETFVEGSALMHVDLGDGFVATPLTSAGPGLFSATFPAAACGTVVKWYISAETVEGSLVVSPNGAPANAYFAMSAEALDVAFDDDFETDLGWTVGGGATTGPWQRGDPPTSGPSYRPHDDADGSGQCYVTGLAGGPGSDLDGTTILLSPVFDASGGGTLAWWYWLAERPQNPAGPEDGMRVEVSTDPEGLEWTVVADYTSYVPEWRLEEITVGSGAAVPASSTLRVRVTAFELPPDDTVEAGLDGVSFVGIVCDAGCTADLDGDGHVAFGDILDVLSNWGVCDGCPADIDADGLVGFSDLLQVLSVWGPCP